MDEIRIGVIGAGSRKVGSSRGNFVARICHAVGGARVTAVYDLAEENARHAASEIAGCRGFGPAAWEAFLDSGIHAAVVASPVPCHAAQSIACLERGVHVLCEVGPTAKLDEARALARAAARSKATYMLAENCNFIDEVELLKRMIGDGLLGEIFYAEGAYLHDVRGLWHTEDGSLTWRARGEQGVYCTHSLGPLLYALEDRVTRVACLATSSHIVDPETGHANNHVLLMRSAKGRTLSVRVDTMSPQPYELKYRVQGSRGVYDLMRCKEVTARVCLGTEHQWQAVSDFAARYIPERRDLPADAGQGGHGSMEFWMMKSWLAALREGLPMPLGVHAALDCALPGILAAESAARDGAPVEVPDSRTW